MKHTPLLAVLLLAFAVPTALVGQQRTALATELDSWGRVSLVDEATREAVGSVGLLRGSLHAVGPGADAVRLFRSAQRSRTVGTALIGVGTAFAAGALVHYIAEPDGLGMSGAQAAAFTGGAGVAILGAHRAWRSQRSLRLAIDSYNGSLALCKAVDGPAGSC